MADLDGHCGPLSSLLVNITLLIVLQIDLEHPCPLVQRSLCASVQQTSGAEGAVTVVRSALSHACGQEGLLHALRHAYTWQVTRVEWEVGVGCMVCGDIGWGAEQMGLIVTGGVIPVRADSGDKRFTMCYLQFGFAVSQ